MSLLPLAALGEIVTYRRVFLGGLALFIVASLGCILSHSLFELVLSRAAQGIGAAGIMRAPNNRALMSSAPIDRPGAAAGLIAISRVTGQISGAMLAALLFRSGSSGKDGHGFGGAGRCFRSIPKLRSPRHFPVCRPTYGTPWGRLTWCFLKVPCSEDDTPVPFWL